MRFCTYGRTNSPPFSVPLPVHSVLFSVPFSFILEKTKTDGKKQYSVADGTGFVPSVFNFTDKGTKGHSSTNMVQRNPHGKNKGKNRSFGAKTTTAFKKKKKMKVELHRFTCEELSHFPKECPD